MSTDTIKTLPVDFIGAVKIQTPDQPALAITDPNALAAFAFDHPSILPISGSRGIAQVQAPHLDRRTADTIILKGHDYCGQ